MRWRRLLTRCWLWHYGEQLRDFDEAGRMILRCSECCEAREQIVLADQQPRVTRCEWPLETSAQFESASTRRRRELAKELTTPFQRKVS